MSQLVRWSLSSSGVLTAAAVVSIGVILIYARVAYGGPGHAISPSEWAEPYLFLVLYSWSVAISVLCITALFWALTTGRPQIRQENPARPLAAARWSLFVAPVIASAAFASVTWFY